MFNVMKHKFSILILIFLYSCNSDCSTEKRNNIRELPIQHINELEQINDMFLKNIKLLEDSCCQNIGSALSGKACLDTDSIRRNYFYPATKHLLNKYLPETEKKTLKLIDKLSPNSFYSNEDIIIPNFSFRADSTVIYPVFHALCGDTITEHFIIFQKKSESSGNFYTNNTNNNNGDIKLVKQKNIKPNWTYYIIKHRDN